ncbi:amidase [Nocardioides carbamazepini]|uniref:amidase n=1 Tax=Nocardioides carbamazepini TaxID=2854259 RepID=UPI00214A748C|nr:amidase [Nocardioides carbamazepini]MCR1784033.1 amidase [Nocardioides carbamazepini]
MDELLDAGAASIASAVRTRKVSPVEVLDATLSRIERINPLLNAVTFVAYDEAKSRAVELERRIGAGEDVGVLAGVPTLMKDLFGHKPGWPATLGQVPGLVGRKATGWSVFPSRMEAAGAIVVGQTNSPVFGFRGTTDNAVSGPTRNPHDLDRNAGGSSGGSAAAVAGGVVPVAGATDGGGSIRIPAAWCGAVGFQPSAGTIPFVNRPNAFGHGLFLYEGPITRSTEDCALALSAMAGPDVRDPLSVGAPRPRFTDCLGERSLRGVRIGFTPDFGIFPVEREIVRTFHEAVRVLESLGAEVEEVTFDWRHSHTELTETWCRTTAVGAYEGIRQLLDEGYEWDTLGPLPTQLTERVLRVPELGVDSQIEDARTRTRVYDEMLGAFATYDLVVSPTVAAMPVPNSDDGDTVGPSSIEGESVDPLIGWCMTYLTNFTGNPSASVPMGTVGGLPVGLQVMGPRYGDAEVLRAISAFELARPWPRVTVPIPLRKETRP